MRRVRELVGVLCVLALMGLGCWVWWAVFAAAREFAAENQPP
jgi:choline-glycine betaine transporter